MMGKKARRRRSKKEEGPREYVPFDETQRKSIFLAGLLIAEGHLKYADDPVGMMKDPDHRFFTTPFRQYSLGEITFKEACDRLNSIRSEIQRDLSESIHLDWLKIIHEKKTGRDFDQDRSALRGQDEMAKDAAVHLVTSFDPTFSKNEDIKKLIGKAVIDEDVKFIDSITRAHLNKPADKKKDLDLLCFKVFNETFLNDPKVTRREDVVKKAIEKKVYFQSEDSLSKYLRRAGLKIKSTTRKKDDGGRKAIREYWEKEIKKSVEAHRQEFRQYLLGDLTVDELKKNIERFKEQLGIK